MGKGKGKTLTLPNGHSIEVSPAYRYALVIDAGKGSWVEGRANAVGPILTRLRANRSIIGKSHIFDTETGIRMGGARFILEH